MVGESRLSQPRRSPTESGPRADAAPDGPSAGDLPRAAGGHGVDADPADLSDLSDPADPADPVGSTDPAPDGGDALYRRIVDTAGAGVFVLDRDGWTVTFANARMAEILRVPLALLVGRSLADFFFEEDVADHRQRMETRRGGASDQYERRFRRADGAPVWALIAATPILDDEGVVGGSFAMLTDITSRKNAEEQLVVTRYALDHVDDAIYLVGDDFLFAYVNQAASRMLGYTEAELLRMGAADIDPYFERPTDNKPADSLAEHHFETHHRTKDGRLIPVEVDYSYFEYKGLSYALCLARDITERQRIAQEQARLVAAVEQADESIVITNPDGTIVYVNPAFERVSGYRRDELIGANPRILKSGRHDRAFYADMWATLKAGRTWRGTIVNQRKDGALYEEDAVISPIFDRSRQVASYVAVKRDVTHERALEEQLRQAQKMEAVGQLAGGIAHDFNNLITAIRGYGEFVRAHVADPEDRSDLDEIVKAADRAAELTRQLLAFSRRQVLAPQVVEPAEVVEQLVPMLQRLVGEHVAVTARAAPDAGRVRVDRTQLEQVIVNLAVNARDAMVDGGQLVIETSNVEEDESPSPGVPGGPLVRLTVSDTGAGMDDDTRAHVFEPFFTTKPAGKGTGMGLATVYGVVRQSGGYVDVSSEPGSGTTFTIYLPRVEDAPTFVATRVAEDVPLGSESILLVEDQAAVRTFAVRVLLSLGYRVLNAADGEEAIAVAAAHPDEIDLLVTDVVMPNLGGAALAERLAAVRPGLRVLFVSGFADVARATDLVRAPAPFLSKPFTREELARAVRLALDGPAEASLGHEGRDSD